VPLQIPPLKTLELFEGWRNGGVKQSNNQYNKADGNVPLQIPTFLKVGALLRLANGRE
jgi:hypothetical protein